jgi:hypothetical protein
MKTRRFAHSFHTIGKPPKGKPCDKLKYHYSGALRELVGILELIAENDPAERFVYANLPFLIEHCHRYKQPTNKFGERWLRQCLAELRARSIISNRLTRYANRQIGGREGFYIVPHDAVCTSIGGPCVFQGYDPGLCASWWAQQPYWAWPHLEISAPKSAPHSAGQNAPHSAPPSAPPSAPHSAGANAPHHSHQVVEVAKVNPENRSLTVVSALPVVSVETARAEPSRIKTAGQGNGAVLPKGEAKTLTPWKRELKEYAEGDELHPALLYSEPYPSDIPTLLALIEEEGGNTDFFDKVNAWAKMRQPPLDGITLKNRWALCLEECFGIQRGPNSHG